MPHRTMEAALSACKSFLCSPNGDLTMTLPVVRMRTKHADISNAA